MQEVSVFAIIKVAGTAIALAIVQTASVYAYDVNRVAIAGIHTAPHGQTYGRWAAEWWQWALSGTTETSPLLDTDGRNCHRRQVGETFFLAGTAGAGTVVRRCTVSAHKALFFPLTNAFYAAFLNDPPELRTPAYIRSQAVCSRPNRLSLEIDGVRVEHDLYRFFTGEGGSPSPFFNTQLAPGNLFGLTRRDARELALSPMAEQGYYVYLWPLSPGRHTLHWIASDCSDPLAVQDITYELTVQ